jgi:cellobiose transport system substrate-binding protein
VSALWADSWDSFLDVGEQYVEATGRGFTDNESNLWNAVVNQDPATYYDADGNLIYDSSPQVQKAWDIVTQASERGVQADIAAWSPEWEAGMSDGSFAVLTCPAWMMGYIMSVAPDTEGNWDLATVPEGGGNWGGSHLAILAQSQNQEAAYDFIEWALAPEQQLKVFVENGNFPSIPALYDTDEVRDFTNEFFSNAPVGQIYAENALDVVSQNIGPDYDFIDSEFVDGLGRVADGAETPDQAWESSLENIRREVG